MVTIQRLLTQAILRLTECSQTPQRDAESLLSDVLKKPRTFLYAWSDQAVSNEVKEAFFERIDKRRAGYPMAYLLGRQSFGSFDLFVNEATLIPRPETEQLVACALEKLNEHSAYRIADLGTGSGAIGLTIAKARPSSHVFATDISPEALSVAKKNAEQLHIANISFYQGNWCDALPKLAYDLIVSNPPYIAANEMHLISPEVHFEPTLALFADENGLAAIRCLLLQVPNYLKPQGYFLLEHGFAQGKSVRSLLAFAGFVEIFTWRDEAGHERVTGGKWIPRP